MQNISLGEAIAFNGSCVPGVHLHCQLSLFQVHHFRKAQQKKGVTLSSDNEFVTGLIIWIEVLEWVARQLQVSTNQTVDVTPIPCKYSKSEAILLHYSLG